VNITDNGSIQYVNMIYDANLTNICTLSFTLDDGSMFTSASQLFGSVLDLSTLTPTIIPSCGPNTSTGQIVFDINPGVNVNIIWQALPFVPVLGVTTNNGVTQLPGGMNYLVVVQDATCLDVFEWFVVSIPISPITFTIDQVIPVTPCTSQTVFAAGSIPGSISGTISGGSGDFDVEWTSGELLGEITNDISQTEINSSDTYTFEIKDNVTLCVNQNGNVTVPSNNLDLDITIQELSPMITNGDINAVGGPPANSIVVSGSLGSTLTISPSGTYNVDYTWSPAGGLNSNDGEYTSVAAVDDYIVAAQLNGSSCAVQSNPYSFSAEVCLGNPDLNWDGVVNGSDQLTLLGVFGLNCACQADFNGDGVVNVIDLLIWINTDPFGDLGCTN
jgi:hypothetical protein